MNANTLILCVAAITFLPDFARGQARVDDVVKSLLKAHNHERKLKKFDPLVLSLKLCEAAQIHANDMASHRWISHTGSDDSTPFERVKRVGYISRHVGENVAQGQDSVGQVMSSWMRSPGHRANILANYTEMGAAWAQDELGSVYWCVDFGTPKFGVPKVPLKPAELATAVAKQINRDRQFERMVVLDLDPTLTRAAMAICSAMAAEDRLKFDGAPEDHIDKTGVEGRELFVKINATASTPISAAKELHRGDVDQLHMFRSFGIGSAVAKSGRRYWCAIFARSVELEPSADPE